MQVESQTELGTQESYVGLAAAGVGTKKLPKQITGGDDPDSDTNTVLANMNSPFAGDCEESTSVKVADPYRHVGTLVAMRGVDEIEACLRCAWLAYGRLVRFLRFSYVQVKTIVQLINALFMKRYGDQDATIGVCDNRRRREPIGCQRSSNSQNFWPALDLLRTL